MRECEALLSDRVQASHSGDGRPPCLSVERVDVGDDVILQLHGEFDLSGVEVFNTAVPTAPRKSVVLDLRHVSFLDSSGLREMIKLHRRAAAEGWSLLLVNPSR